MKKLLFVLALVALVSTGSAQTVSTANFQYPLPVADMAFSEVLTPATPTLTLSDVAKAMPAMPGGTKAVFVKATNGIVYWGPSTMVVSDGSYGAGSAWQTIASGSSIQFNYPTIAPKASGIYFINAATGTPALVRFTPVR